MSDLFENIIFDLDNQDDLIVKSILQSKKEVLVYGNGAHAKATYEYLKRKGVVPKSYVVDEEYHKDGIFINGVAVASLLEFENNLEKYILVIGFDNVDKTKFLLENRVLLKPSVYLIWEPIELYKWDKNYLEENKNELEMIYSQLADQTSKDILKCLVRAKLSKDGRELLKLSDSTQYFNDITKDCLSDDEVYVDCGAFNGDTIQKFIRFTKCKYKKIFAFEPSEDNYNKLKENTKGLYNIQYINKGLWDVDATLSFYNDGSASEIVEGKSIDKECIKVPVTSIDKVVEGSKVTFIKMDIEGSELKALEGAKETISKWHPKLAICCYHKKTDIVDLYNYISSFSNDNIEYEFYLRHHSNGAYETVLYAIGRKK